MEHSRLMILLLLLSLSGTSHAVGFQRISIPDPADKPIAIGIWYPSDAPAPFENNTPFRQALSIGAKPSGSNLPMVVLSHGYGGWMGGHANTAKLLAEAGFVAVAPTHTGNNYNDESYPISRWLLDRPRHISLAIDYLQNNWIHRKRLDKSSIGAFGFSAGGYTVMALSGAVPDAKTVEKFCRNHPNDFTCGIGVLETLTSEPFQNLTADEWGLDKRISAAVVIAPALGFAYNKAGLEGVNIPLQIWSAEFDTRVPDISNARVIQSLLPQAPDYQFVKKAGHYVFLQPCDPRLEEVNPNLWSTICVDAEGFDRLEFQAKFNQKVIQFFRKHTNRQR